MNRERPTHHLPSSTPRYLVNLARRSIQPGDQIDPHSIDGQPGAVVARDGRPFEALSLDVRAGMVHRLWIIINPDKLTSLARPPGRPDASRGGVRMITNALHVATRRIALASPYGFFTTDDGELQTRMVQHLHVTEGCDITFSTGPNTRKARAIRAHPSIAYAVHDPGTLAAAVIYGKASIDHDGDRREQLWCESLAPFFPDGPTSDSFTLIHIEAERIEAWSLPDGLAPPPFGLSSMQTTRSTSSWSEPTGTHPR